MFVKSPRNHHPGDPSRVNTHFGPKPALHCTALRRSRTWVWFTTIKSLAPPPLPPPHPLPTQAIVIGTCLPWLRAHLPCPGSLRFVSWAGGRVSHPADHLQTKLAPSTPEIPTFFPTTCTSAPHPRTALSFCFCYSITIPLTYRLTTPTPARIDRGLCCLFDCAQPTFTAIRLRNPAAFASHIPPSNLSRSLPIPCATIE
jgi:hypothetical protein